MKSIILFFFSSLLFVSCITKDYNTGKYSSELIYYPKPAFEENETKKRELYIGVNFTDATTYQDEDQSKLYSTNITQSHIFRSSEDSGFMSSLSYGAEYYYGEYENKELASYDTKMDFSGYSLGIEAGVGYTSEYFDLLFCPGYFFSHESGDFMDFQEEAFAAAAIDSYNPDGETHTFKADLEFKFKSENDMWFSLIAGDAFINYTRKHQSYSENVSDWMIYMGANYRIKNLILWVRSYIPFSNVYEAPGTFGITYMVF